MKSDNNLLEELNIKFEINNCISSSKIKSVQINNTFFEFLENNYKKNEVHDINFLFKDLISPSNYEFYYNGYYNEIFYCLVNAHEANPRTIIKKNDYILIYDDLYIKVIKDHQFKNDYILLN